MTRHFFLNYGGPGGRWTSNTLDRTNYLDKRCQESYGMPIRKIQYNIKGVDVTICTYGIHRALRLDIPDGASQDAINAFEEAKKVGLEICTREYSLLGNNCVTAVAKALNSLDNRMTPGNMIWPWNLDKNVKKYRKYYPEHTIAGSFISKYTEIAHREFFAFMRVRHWQEKIIDSHQDIITHAYGKKKGQGERTKSTLIELGWVKEDKQHILRPTEKSPSEFKIGLEEFNRGYEKMLHLKSLYKTEASFFSQNARNFFEDNPDYETALERVKRQAIKNPTGASAKVLEILNKKQLNDEKITTLIHKPF